MRFKQQAARGSRKEIYLLFFTKLLVNPKIHTSLHISFTCERYLTDRAIMNRDG